MKRVLLIAGLLVLAALDWAALHDILKQNEPNYTAEYTMLATSALIFAGVAFRALRTRRA